jgi:hypothetical protein
VIDVREYLEELATIKADLVGVKKGVEVLGQRSQEEKKGNEEHTRHRRSYGPAVASALVGGLMALAGVLLTYWLNRPK